MVAMLGKDAPAVECHFKSEGTCKISIFSNGRWHQWNLHCKNNEHTSIGETEVKTMIERLKGVSVN